MMGTEALWVPLVVGAVSAGASAYNTNRTEKKQDNQLAQQISRQGEDQRKIDQRTQQLLAEAQASSPEAEKASALQSYVDQLARNDAGGAINQGAGGFSDAYRADAQDAALGVGQYGEKMAGLLSRMDAPTRQRQNEGVLFNNAATDIGLLKRGSSGQDYLDQLKLQSIKRNPWIDAAASAMSGYASAGGGTGGSWGFQSPVGPGVI